MNIFAFCEKINNLVIFIGPEKIYGLRDRTRVPMYNDCVHSGAGSSTAGGGVAMAKEIVAHSTKGESTLLQNGVHIRDAPEGIVNMKEHLFLK